MDPALFLAVRPFRALLAVAALALVVAGTATAGTGPIAAYSFDEGSGTVARDVSGLGNNGSLTGATWAAAGKHGGALSFNGSSARVTVPASKSLDLGSAFTLEAWVKPSSLGSSYRSVIVREQPKELVYALYASTDKGVPAGIRYANGKEVINRGPKALPLGVWSHLASTYDGQNVRLYVNGTLVSTAAATGAMPSSTGALSIGGNGVWSEWFTGLVDDVRIYNRALGASELQSDMNAAVAAPAPAPSADKTSPSVPQGERVASVTDKTIGLAWLASTDNVGVVGYDVFLNGAKVGTTTSTSYTFSGLTCGTTYSVGLEARDAAGNHSDRAFATGTSATSPCATQPSPPSSSGNLFVSPSGSDSAACTQAAPCKSLDRAYHVAKPGQVVQLAGGSYPGQSIKADSAKTSSSDVVFQPAAGAKPSIAGLEVYGAHITLANLNFTAWPYIRTRRTADHVTLRNDTAAKFEILGSSNVSLLGGTYGPIDNDSNNVAPESPSDSKVPTNILLDGVTIHGYHRTDGTSHVDCIHSWGGNGITIRNSTISDCEHFDILFTVDSVVGTPTNVTIENNFLDCCRSGFFSVYLGDQHGEKYSNYLIRNNSTDKPIGIGTSNIQTVSGLNFYGNVAPSFQGCGKTGVSADYNVWYAGSKCGSHDQVAASGFVNAAGHDFHLVSGAAAIDHGDPSSYPAKDVDGQARPAGAAPDAGADETAGAAVAAAPPTAAPAAPQGGKTLYMSPGGSDSASCTQSAPCKSFDRAYHVASPGDVVLVAAGSYPGQTVKADSAKAPTASIANVVFKPASGASVSVSGELRVEGSHVEFHDMSMGDWYTGINSNVPESSQTAHLGFYNVEANSFYDHASYVDIVGGSYGPLTDDATQVSDCYQCNYSPQHITIDGVYFHDFVRKTSGVHMECLHVYAASYLTVKNSKFYNCAIMDVFVNNYSGSPDIHDIVIENNFFDRPGSHGGSLSDGSYSLYVTPYFSGRSISNVTVRNNSSLGTLLVDTDTTGATVKNAQVINNLSEMAGYQCVAAGNGVSYSHNVWYSGSSTTKACGSTDRALSGGSAAAGYADAASFNLHITKSSPALNAGDTVNATKTDIDGQGRPMGSAPDVGADEQG